MATVLLLCPSLPSLAVTPVATVVSAELVLAASSFFPVSLASLSLDEPSVIDVIFPVSPEEDIDMEAGEVPLEDESASVAEEVVEVISDALVSVIIFEALPIGKIDIFEAPVSSAWCCRICSVGKAETIQSPEISAREKDMQ